MGLKIMKDKDGNPRDTWYARFTRNGGKVNVNLCVPIRGKVPTATDASGRAVFDVNGTGDAAFEKSRKAAQYEHVNDKGFPDRRTGIVRMVKPYFARAIFEKTEPAPAMLADAEPMPLADVSADTAAVAPACPSVDDFIASMSEDQRKELARKLLGL